jgi:lysophospholipase L1-like esterase
VPSRYWTLLGNLLLAVASVGGFLLLIELGAKVAGLPIGAPLLPNRYNCVQRSSLLSLDFRPHCHGLLPFTVFDTNSLGLRSPEVRDDGSSRILTIGDSCTWGYGVAQDASYPAVLQRLLDQRSDGARYQVINAGVPGYTSYQGLLYLRERGLVLHPSILILGYGFNDATPDGDVEEQLAAERRLPPLMLVDDFLFQHSRAYAYARRRMMAARRDPRQRVDPIRFEQHLEEMVKLARADGAHTMALSFSGTQSGPYGEALTSVTTRLATPLVTYQGPRFDVVHPTAEGYRALAALILERLEQEGWVDPAPAPSQSAAALERHAGDPR